MTINEQVLMSILEGRGQLDHRWLQDILTVSMTQPLGNADFGAKVENTKMLEQVIA